MRRSILVATVLGTVIVVGCESSDGDVEASGEVAATASPSIGRESDPTETVTEDPR